MSTQQFSVTVSVPGDNLSAQQVEEAIGLSFSELPLSVKVLEGNLVEPVTDVTTILPWRVQRDGTTVAAFDHMPTERELSAVVAINDDDATGGLEHHIVRFTLERI